jgi:hypothetical protein
VPPWVRSGTCMSSGAHTVPGARPTRNAAQLDSILKMLAQTSEKTLGLGARE